MSWEENDSGFCHDGKYIMLVECNRMITDFFPFLTSSLRDFFSVFPISDVVVYFISTLELRLRQQEFVELVRSSKRMDAVNHARKYFSVVDVEHMPKVQQLMGLLAFTEDTKVSPYMVRLCTHSLNPLCYCGTIY